MLYSGGDICNPRVMKQMLVCCTVAALLTACGGGGGGSPNTMPPPTSADPPPATTPPPTPPPPPSTTSAGDVTTFKNDVARTGQFLTETTLTTANVNSTSFGLLHNVKVDGKVDAQPLYLSQLGGKNVVIVATEHASVYWIDADS